MRSALSRTPTGCGSSAARAEFAVWRQYSRCGPTQRANQRACYRAHSAQELLNACLGWGGAGTRHVARFSCFLPCLLIFPGTIWFRTCTKGRFAIARSQWCDCWEQYHRSPIGAWNCFRTRNESVMSRRKSMAAIKMRKADRDLYDWMAIGLIVLVGSVAVWISFVFLG